MKANELKLAAVMLEMAENEFSNHGCNDVDESVWKDWSIEERRTFVKEIGEWNGDTEEYDEDHLYLPDWYIMAFLAHKLKEESDKL
jgi:hypothetical protein